MDRFSAMRVLLAAVDAGSLTAAGRALGAPLATVSRKISELEAHLRTQIFVRSNRRLVLTDAGRAYVEACRRILDDIDEAERAAAGEYSAPHGVLTVAAPVVFGRLHLLPVLAGFLSAYPNIDVRLELSDRSVDFLEEHVDVAVRVGVLPDSDLVAAKVSETRQVVCASPSYIAARGRPRTPDDLARHDCITFDRLNGPDAWVFATAAGELRAALNSRLVVSTADAAIDAAIAGVGVTRVLDYQIGRAVLAGELTRVLQKFEPPPLPISVVYPRPGRLPVKLRAFLDFVTPRLRAAAH